MLYVTHKVCYDSLSLHTHCRRICVLKTILVEPPPILKSTTTINNITGRRFAARSSDKKIFSDNIDGGDGDESMRVVDFYGACPENFYIGPSMLCSSIVLICALFLFFLVLFFI